MSRNIGVIYKIQGMDRKNLSLYALKKLLNGEIRSCAKINLVETRGFSKRLEEAVLATIPTRFLPLR